MDTPHISVFCTTVLEAVAHKTLHRICDCTVGAGGHLAALLEAHPTITHCSAIDRDAAALIIAQKRCTQWCDRIHWHHCAYDQAPYTPSYDLILADLGLSSMQLDSPKRGFSFRWDDAPLDMTMGECGVDAATFLNNAPRNRLIDIFQKGETPGTYRLVRAILEQRQRTPFVTMKDFLAVIPDSHRSHHKATIALQSLRMAINDELATLERALPQWCDALAPGGLLLIITFHSLEDRRVKHALKARKDGTLLWKKPRTPSDEECRHNRRARSAKLRGWQKC